MAVDTEAILKSVNSRRDEYVTGLEKDWSELQNALKPLREAEDAIARAIHEAVGQFPSDYNGAAARVAARSTPARSTASTGTRTRSTMSEEEREGAAMEFIAANPEGVNAKQVAEQVGVSTATMTKTINSLLESGRIRSEGERRARKLLPA